MQKLTQKQNRFIKEVIKGENGTQAAIKAGYSKKTAKEMAYENLMKPHIKHKIELTMSEEAKKLGITAEYILSGIKNLAEAGDARIAVKSFELLGRHMKLFHDTERNLILTHQEIQQQIEELE